MSFDRDANSALRNQLDKILKGCQLEREKNTSTWESPWVPATRAASQLKKIFQHLEQHYQTLHDNKRNFPKLDHLWLYIDKGKATPRPAAPVGAAARVVKTLILILACTFLITGCSDSKVVLQSKDGSRKLLYDGNNFQPQVQTAEDIAILIGVASETLSDAASNHAVMTMKEISDGLARRDWRTVEREVVMYRASHKK
jgi:hypothetical protein